MLQRGKKALVLLLALTVALCCVGLAQAAEITLKLSHEAPTTDQRHTAAMTFARVVEEKTGGKAKVEVFPAATLGAKEEIQMGMQVGTADILIEDVGTLQRFDAFAALGFMPFIYRDQDHFLKVWNSPVKDEIFNEIEKRTGFKLMGVMYRGGRHITAVRPMKTIADLKGLKIRVPGSEVCIATWEALGASPTPMAFPEVFGALQQKVIDAQENPLNTIQANSLQEVAPNITLSGHVVGAFNFQFWGENYAKYPDWLKDALKEAALVASKEYTDSTAGKEAKILEKLKADPKVELITLSPEERKKWQEKVTSVYDKYPNLKPYLNKIINEY